jgi:hypothetical protein
MIYSRMTYTFTWYDLEGILLPPFHDAVQVQELHGNPWPKAHRGPVSMPSSGFPIDSTAAIDISISAQQPPHSDTLISSEKSVHPEPSRPRYHRRPSHDLFECIEQSPHQRLSEVQARYIFAQIVDAVHYLDQHGVTHRDIKDENLVIDKNLNVNFKPVSYFYHY